jgi:hypothetical protein
MSEAKKPAPVVRIFRGPQPDVALPDIPLGRQLRPPPTVGVPVKGVVDLKGKPRIILAIGAGRSGKSTACRLIGETSLDRSIEIVGAVGERRDLMHYFRGAVQPVGFDPAQEAQWLEALMAHCMEEQVSAVVDMDGGDQSLSTLLEQQDDLVATVERAGVAIVALYMLTPRVSDLTTLATLEQAGFQPKATALILNGGTIEGTTSFDEAFGSLKRHAAYQAALARGAVEIRMPRLLAAAAVEARMIGFEHARDGTFPPDRTGVPLKAFDRGRVARWLALMSDAFSPLTKAGWW